MYRENVLRRTVTVRKAAADDDDSIQTEIGLLDRDLGAMAASQARAVGNRAHHSTVAQVK